MLHEIETFQHNGFTVKLCLDPCPENPRKVFDHMATLYCCHRGYDLGDTTPAWRNEPLSKEEIIEREGAGQVLAILPLYVYEHGGITMSAGGFSDRWDSGQVGWGYVTREGAEKMGCIGETYDTAFFERAIKGEVEEYDHYLTGQVYGYVVEDAEGDELESCWGFYGDLDYVRSEARSAAEHARPLGKVDGGATASCHD
jgi:hypothetical protein